VFCDPCVLCDLIHSSLFSTSLIPSEISDFPVCKMLGSHYCDVMIGSQSMIGNLISDLHKILHDNIYQGSIVLDKLGIKQIDSNLDRISAMESSW
jgi:hypothetical protein